MKKSSKAKLEKRVKSKKAGEPALPDLVSAMMKIAERLEGLEGKVETVLTQMGQLALRASGQPHFQRPAQPPSSFQNQPGNSQHSQSYSGHPQNRPRNQAGQQGQSQNRQHQHAHSNRPQRPLYQTVCADCRKNCEIPFKPSGDRPVYCKECFAARKAQKHSSGKPQPPAGGGPLTLQKKQVRVIPNGVGKVTISEMVASSAKAKSFKSPKQGKLAKKNR